MKLHLTYAYIHYCGCGKSFEAHMSDIWLLSFQLLCKEFIVRPLDGNITWPQYFKVIDTRNAGGRKLDVNILNGTVRTLMPATAKAAREIMLNISKS